MEILSISKKDKKITVSLTSDDLVKICNVLYNAKEEHKNGRYYELYGDMMLARDLSQYGHVDGFCFESIAECRRKQKEYEESLQ